MPVCGVREEARDGRPSQRADRCFQTKRRNMHVLTQFVDQFKLHLAVEDSRIRSLRHLIQSLRADEEADYDEEVRWPLNNKSNRSDCNLCLSFLGSSARRS